MILLSRAHPQTPTFSLRLLMEACTARLRGADAPDWPFRGCESPIAAIELFLPRNRPRNPRRAVAHHPPISTYEGFPYQWQRSRTVEMRSEILDTATFCAPPAIDPATSPTDDNWELGVVLSRSVCTGRGTPGRGGVHGNGCNEGQKEENRGARTGVQKTSEPAVARCSLHSAQHRQNRRMEDGGWKIQDFASIPTGRADGGLPGKQRSLIALTEPLFLGWR